MTFVKTLTIIINVKTGARNQTRIGFIAPVFAILIVVITHKEEVSLELLLLGGVQLAVFDSDVVALVLALLIIAAVLLAGGSDFGGVLSRSLLRGFGFALILSRLKV